MAALLNWLRSLFFTDRTCVSCGLQKVDRGSNFKCVVCDADPDPRP
jgi:hypothetical protein